MNPPEWERVISRFPATRDVRFPHDEDAANAQEILTNLYDVRSQPLADALAALDAAVAAAYGWAADICDDEVLRELLARDWSRR